MLGLGVAKSSTILFLIESIDIVEVRLLSALALNLSFCPPKILLRPTKILLRFNFPRRR